MEPDGWGEVREQGAVGRGAREQGAVGRGAREQGAVERGARVVVVVR